MSHPSKINLALLASRFRPYSNFAKESSISVRSDSHVSSPFPTKRHNALLNPPTPQHVVLTSHTPFNLPQPARHNVALNSIQVIHQSPLRHPHTSSKFGLHLTADLGKSGARHVALGIYPPSGVDSSLSSHDQRRAGSRSWQTPH